MTELHTLAGEAYRQFETKTRDSSGESFVSVRDDAPGWVGEMVRDAHGDMLPDDWRYATIRDAVEAIEEAGVDADLDDKSSEFADAVDAYTGELLAWASTGSRLVYCDEARIEGLVADHASMDSRLMAGQYLERREVFESVRQSLAELAEDGDEESPGRTAGLRSRAPRLLVKRV